MPFTPNLGQFSKSMSRKLSLPLTLGAAIFALSTGTANAQSFTVTTPANVSGGTVGTASGDVDLNGDGTIDGTWSLSLAATSAGADMREFSVYPGAFIGAYTDVRTNGGSGPWDLDTDFTIISSVPGVTFAPTFRGSLTFPDIEGFVFQNNAGSYTFNWGGAGTAQIIDPRSQLVTSGLSDGLTFSQTGAAGTISRRLVHGAEKPKLLRAKAVAF